VAGRRHDAPRGCPCPARQGHIHPDFPGHGLCANGGTVGVAAVDRACRATGVCRGGPAVLVRRLDCGGRGSPAARPAHIGAAHPLLHHPGSRRIGHRIPLQRVGVRAGNSIATLRDCAINAPGRPPAARRADRNACSTAESAK